jgi:transcriptional regulator with XRE-family HTH domain
MAIPEKLKPDLADKEFAHGYVDEFLNVSIATQLKVLREQRELTQEQLANLAGMKQERISVLENVNYSSWSINPLRKLAKALDVTLKVSFETFGSRLIDMGNINRRSLERMSREDELALKTPTPLISNVRSSFVVNYIPSIPPKIPRCGNRYGGLQGAAQAPQITRQPQITYSTNNNLE